MNAPNAGISARELADRLASPNPPRLLDVRQPEEHALASIPGATLVPLGELGARHTELESWKQNGDTIVVYCHHGMRSLRAIGFLKQQGFSNLLNLGGGIDAWSLDVDPRVRRY